MAPRAEVAVAYMYTLLRPGDPLDTLDTHGGTAGFAYNFSRAVGIVGEFGGGRFTRTVAGLNMHGKMLTYLFGPRFSLRRSERVVPFAEFLVGGARGGGEFVGSNEGRNTFALAAGGGLDIVLTDSVAWRLAQVDYLGTNFSGPALPTSRQDNLRMGSGLVFRFGNRTPAPPPARPNRPPVASCAATPTSVYAGSGDTVAIHVTASDPDNDPLTYSYTATGGTVSGTGPDARWDSSGLAVGTYTVTAKVDDGRGGTATCAVDIKVETRPNRPPTISCTTERSPIVVGEHTKINCVASDPDNDPLTYSCTTTGGRVSGAGPVFDFDATGTSPGNYQVTCTADDGRGGRADSTTGVEVQAPKPTALEMRLSLRSVYFVTAQPTVQNPRGGLLLSQQRTLVELSNDFKKYLQTKPDAHLILGGHTDPRGSAEYNQGLSERRVERVKSFLIEHGVPAGNIETKAYGLREQLSPEIVKGSIEEDPEITAEEKQRILRNMRVIVLASNRRVDVTLSTTGEQSLRRYPFNAEDALTLIGGREKPKGPAKRTAPKKPAPNKKNP